MPNDRAWRQIGGYCFRLGPARPRSTTELPGCRRRPSTAGDGITLRFWWPEVQLRWADSSEGSVVHDPVEDADVLFPGQAGMFGDRGSVVGEQVPLLIRWVKV